MVKRKSRAYLKQVLVAEEMKPFISDDVKANLVDSVSVPIAFMDRAKEVIWANRAYQQTVGISLEELCGKKCHQVFGLSGPCHHCPVSAAIETETSATAELTSSNLDSGKQALLPCLATIDLVRNKQSDIIGAVVTLPEIHAEKKAETALQESEARLREAQRLAHLGSWELDLERDTLTWSDEIFRIFEIDPSKFNATYEAFLSVVHPDDRVPVDNAYKISLEKKIPYEIEHRLLMKDGRVKFIHERCKTLFDDQGKSIRSIGTVWDITERKVKEDENRKLQERYIRSQKLETVGRLAGGVAHDFNNMLGVIIGQADLAMEALSPTAPTRHRLTEINKAAERSSDLVRQLLAFAGRQTTEPKFLNLNTVIESMIKILHRLIGEDINFAWMPTENIGTVKMDPSQLDQIMANLCVNARDAINDVGKITIETHNACFDDAYCEANPGFIPGEYIMLAVSDDGCGMDKETLDQIFEPFFTTKEAGRGTGLGLATVYGLVKQNNGFINVYSEPGKGTTFKIYLARHRTEADPVEKKTSGRLQMGNDETILLVEDEAFVLDTSREVLEKLGYRVLAANSPTEALRYASGYGKSIDLLLTDVVMPEMNGAELAEKIGRLCPDAKTIFMSAYTANVISRHGVLKEGVAFLQKPISKEVLADKIHGVLSDLALGGGSPTPGNS